jgi:hypothetical protein
MALARTDLTPVYQVGSASTVGVVTVGSAQTCYIKSIMIHNLDGTTVQNTKIHVVPNSGGSAGSASSTTQIARLGIGTDDTFFFEPAYPIVMKNNGDTLQIQNEGSAINAVNVLVTGDLEI